MDGLPLTLMVIIHFHLHWSLLNFIFIEVEKNDSEDIPEIPGTGNANKGNDSDEDAPEINLDDLSIKDNITMEDPVSLRKN